MPNIMNYSLLPVILQVSRALLSAISLFALKGRLRVGSASWVSPELPAPVPAALGHGACGPERRLRLTGVN